MTDKQLITKAAEFMGWIEDSWETDCGCSPTAYVKERGGDAQAWKDKWNPLTSLDDAWMLVEKMQKYKERGHREEMAFNVLDKIAHAQIQEMSCVQAARAITLVVLEAAGKLDKKKKRVVCTKGGYGDSNPCYDDGSGKCDDCEWNEGKLEGEDGN